LLSESTMVTLQAQWITVDGNSHFIQITV
jgi:hypothetical protein